MRWPLLVSVLCHGTILLWVGWAMPLEQTISRGQKAQPLSVAIVMQTGQQRQLSIQREAKKEIKKPEAVKKAPQAELPPKAPEPTPQEEEEAAEAARPGGAPSYAAQLAQIASAGTHTGQENYYAQLKAHLEQYKTYPRRARAMRQQGEVHIQFLLHRTGRVLSMHLTQSSGHTALDSAALEAVQAATPLPPFPPHITQEKLSITVPFSFSLNQ